MTNKILPFQHRKYYGFTTNFLGKGTYGEVYTTVNIMDEKMVEYALKTYTNVEWKDNIDQTIMRELTILRFCNHPNIIRLIDIIINPETMAFEAIMEHGGKSIIDIALARKDGKYGETVKKEDWQDCMVQLLEGVSYLHSHDIMHRDIKSANILYNKSTKLYKLIDFGMARSSKKYNDCGYTVDVSTYHYQPPEMTLNMKNYGFEVDIYSLGIVFIEHLCDIVLNLPITWRDISSLIYRQIDLLGGMTEEEWPGISKLPCYTSAVQCYAEKTRISSLWSVIDVNTKTKLAKDDKWRDLIGKMVVANPSKRFSAKDLLSHPYINDFRKESGDRESGDRESGDRGGITSLNSVATEKERRLYVCLSVISGHFRSVYDTFFHARLLVEKYFQECKEEDPFIIAAAAYNIASIMWEMWPEQITYYDVLSIHFDDCSSKIEQCRKCVKDMLIFWNFNIYIPTFAMCMANRFTSLNVRNFACHLGELVYCVMNNIDIDRLANAMCAAVIQILKETSYKVCDDEAVKFENADYRQNAIFYMDCLSENIGHLGKYFIQNYIKKYDPVNVIPEFAKIVRGEPTSRDVSLDIVGFVCRN